MKINQDTFTNDRLNFGAYNTTQRDELYKYRLDLFRELILKEYPEHYMKLQGDRKSVSQYTTRLRSKSSFKLRNKLSYALTYGDLETLNTSEFRKILGKFNRFLLLHADVERELKQIFSKG